MALRRFVGDAAHEIGTPLTALRADLELAEGVASTDDERRLIGRALGQADRLQSLSESLLSLSRIEAGDPNGTIERVDLAATVSEAAEAVASRAEQAGLDAGCRRRLVGARPSWPTRAACRRSSRACSTTPSSSRPKAAAWP